MPEHKLSEECHRYGVEVDKWPKGIAHHPKSENLVRGLVEIDFGLFGDYFCWKVGGDGDNGETLMYEMDIYFELQEARDQATAACTAFTTYAELLEKCSRKEDPYVPTMSKSQAEAAKVGKSLEASGCRVYWVR